MISKRRLTTKLDAAVPPLFQHAVLSMLTKCYKDAHSNARDALGLHPRIVPWGRAYIRRMLIQSQLFELAEKYKPNLEPEWRKTILGGNEYVAIKAGDFIITEAKVNAPGELPAHAEYRSTNSAMSYSLFPEGHQSETGIFYTLISHVPHPTEPRPMHASLIFPDLEYTRIIHEFDLIERFGNTLTKSDGIERTQEANPQPKLRKAGMDEQEAQ